MAADDDTSDNYASTDDASTASAAVDYDVSDYGATEDGTPYNWASMVAFPMWHRQKQGFFILAISINNGHHS